jgi:hypothetical protein
MRIASRSARGRKSGWVGPSCPWQGIDKSVRDEAKENIEGCTYVPDIKKFADARPECLGVKLDHARGFRIVGERQNPTSLWRVKGNELSI